MLTLLFIQFIMIVFAVAIGLVLALAVIRARGGDCGKSN
jgi:hypothetical protein